MLSIGLLRTDVDGSELGVLNSLGHFTGRRGKRVAVVALARKLAGILYAMMRDETEFNDKYWTAEKRGV